MTPRIVVHDNRLADVLDIRQHKITGYSYSAYLLRYRDDDTERWVFHFQCRELTAAEYAVLRLRGMVKR